MISLEFRIKNKNGIYNLYTKSKYTIILGDSATGKTCMLDDWHRSEVPNFCRRVSRASDISDTQFLPTNTVFIMDEDVANTLTKTDYAIMNNAKQQFIIITRDIPSQLAVDYRDICYFRTSGKYHIQERFYKDDFDKFIYNKRYVCEDSNSGYQYYNSKLTNVTPANGNSSIPKMIDKTTTVIADGSAYGAFIHHIIDDCNLFLPISFEYLVCKKLHPNDVRCTDSVYEYWDGSKYVTLEQYYTALLYDFTKHYSQPYTKSKCPDYILNMNLLEG